MSNYEELIIKYLDRQLSEKERTEFENLLLTNSELRIEFENYRKVNELFSNDYKPELANNYFNNIIREFRQKIETKNKPVIYRKYGMAFTTVFLAVTLFFIADKLFVNQNVQSVVGDFSDEELKELADFYSNENYSLLSGNEDMILLSSTDLNMETIVENSTSEEKISMISEFDLDEIYSSVDDDVLETAYNEILTKRIF